MSDGSGANTRHGISVKICGLTHTEHVRYCRRAGVDACGLIFAETSPRRLRRDRACEIFECARRLNIATVFVFMNQDEAFIRSCLSHMVPDYLQFHGSETPEFCARFAAPYIKSCPANHFVGAGTTGSRSLSDFYRQHARACAILLDCQAAGSGQTWSWRRLPQNLACRTIVAGGLNAANVRDAVTVTGCPAVDLSSGVEDGPGRKSAALIENFMERVRVLSLPTPSGGRVFSF